MRRFFGFGWVALTAMLVSAGSVQAEELTIASDAQAIVAQLDVQDPYLRQKAFMQLEALRDPSTVPVVQAHLKSRNSATRAFSARALAAIDGVHAIPLLLERLHRDKSPRVRLAAVLALEPLDDPRVMPALIGKLRDHHPDVRMAVADAVSRINHPDARAAILLRARRERNRDVQRVLQDAVQRMNAPRG